MGKKAGKVTAKGRLDKFYHLAKEQGYRCCSPAHPSPIRFILFSAQLFRSRAAYKLIQVNIVVIMFASDSSVAAAITCSDNPDMYPAQQEVRLSGKVSKYSH